MGHKYANYTDLNKYSIQILFLFYSILLILYIALALSISLDHHSVIEKNILMYTKSVLKRVDTLSTLLNINIFVIFLNFNFWPFVIVFIYIIVKSHDIFN